MNTTSLSVPSHVASSAPRGLVGSARWTTTVRIDSREMPPLGIVSEQLRRTDGTHVVVRGPDGADRVSVARAIHLTSAERYSGRLFITDASPFEVTGLLDAVIADTSAAADRPQTGDTLFVDDFHRLDDGARVAILQARERLGCRLIMGADSSIPVDGLGRVAMQSIDIIPLGRRPDDISRIAAEAAFRFGVRLAPDAVSYLRQQTFAGDVEELRRIVSQAAEGLSAGGEVEVDDLRLALSRNTVPDTTRSLADVEREHIMRVLDSQGWNRTRSARMLGIDVKTLYNKLKRYKARDRVDSR